jgi:histidinol-phosphate phosphatase family protein
MKRAVFLDRDGVINRVASEGKYIIRWDEMYLLPGVAEAICLLNASGFLVIVVTNQRCVAKGLITVEDLELLHQKMCGELAAMGAMIDRVYFCPHDMEPPCSCRKPAPGMLLEAARDHNIALHESWMVGDSTSDIKAGINAGCKTAQVIKNQRLSKDSGDVNAPSLLGIVHKIVESDEHHNISHNHTATEFLLR